MNSAEFRRLAESHREAVFRAARRILGNDEDSLDVTQECLLKLARHGSELSAAGTRAWLVRVATHAAIDRLRRRDPLGEAQRIDGVSPAAPAPPDPLEASELRERVRRALATLPPRQAEIVVLRYFEGMRFAEAAHAMGISDGAAKVHFRRAIAHLHDRLGALDPAAAPPLTSDRRSTR